MKLDVGNKYQSAVLIVALLVIANISQLFIKWPSSWIITVLIVVFLLLIAKVSNLNLVNLGLGKKFVSTGLLWGGLSALAVFIVLFLAFIISPDAFKDSRYDNGMGHALYSALIIIPLHTVLVEELAFRGVLWASLKRAKTTLFATIVSSVIFGLWHIIPSINLNSTSRDVSNAVGSGDSGQVLSVIGVVAITMIAGIALCELRRRSDSLIASIMAHWAINGGAVILAALAWAK